ncbi:MAG TPA: class I SAM-dependent methyltransferase [Acetobacteraceae bacterium]|nr:class I SAM-dependent methyltransferase [Acetobacteraceae bacterium]
MTNPDALSLYLAGRISAQVALARLILGGATPGDIARHLAGVPGDRAASLRHLLAHRDRLDRLAEVASCIDHGVAGPSALAAFRDGFDRAAAISPEAGVAAYSLGDPALLRMATEELVSWLAARGLLRGAVLDLGCGIGRVAAALAPHVEAVLGLDIAPGMIAEARRRYGARARFAATSGTRLALPDESFNLILAVDTFPYLVQAEVAEDHVTDAARVLRPGGALAILNLSYRGLEADWTDARRWAARHGLALACAGEQPFRLWDGRAFLLLKPRAAG